MQLLMQFVKHLELRIGTVIEGNDPFQELQGAHWKVGLQPDHAECVVGIGYKHHWQRIQQRLTAKSHK